MELQAAIPDYAQHIKTSVTEKKKFMNNFFQSNYWEECRSHCCNLLQTIL